MATAASCSPAATSAALGSSWASSSSSVGGAIQCAARAAASEQSLSPSASLLSDECTGEFMLKYRRKRARLRLRDPSEGGSGASTHAHACCLRIWSERRELKAPWLGQSFGLSACTS